MTRYSEIVKLITKYALLLSILYAIQLLTQYALATFIEPIKSPGLNLRNFLQVAISTVGNLITMFFVMQDKKKFQIKNRFLEILTFFYRPIGVCVLLIQVILEENKSMQNADIQSKID